MPPQPEDIHVYVCNIEYLHTLVYEGVVAGAHHWMLRVPIEDIPYPQEVRMEIGVFPAHTSIELFWELP